MGLLGSETGVGEVNRPEILFSRLEDEAVESFRLRFSGSQKERAAGGQSSETGCSGNSARAAGGNTAEKAAVEAPMIPSDPPEVRFRKKITLIVAKITAIRRHPEADKLYIETIDCGTETRQIVSGLVPHYREDELLGKHIVLAANLKPAKLRGVVSAGMLLAANDGAGKVEVLDAGTAAPGTAVKLAGDHDQAEPVPETIDIDTFFSVPIRARGGVVMVGDTPLECAGIPLRTTAVLEGTVG